jgi:hypothetical protein
LVYIDLPENFGGIFKAKRNSTLTLTVSWVQATL